MSDLTIFFVEDQITEEEKDLLTFEVEKKSFYIPGSYQDYVLVQRPYGAFHIRFFRKDRIDNACKQTGMTPKEFIYSMFKSCGSAEFCKFHKEEELARLRPHQFRRKDDDNCCRVCGNWLEDGVARYNDYMLFKYEEWVIMQPICNWCADHNPDEQHKKYKESAIYKKSIR